MESGVYNGISELAKASPSQCWNQYFVHWIKNIE